MFLRILRLFFWFNCFLFLDVLQAGVWKHRQDLKSKKLKELADSLPAFVLCSRAVSTNVKYKNAWLNWKKWDKDNILPDHMSIFCPVRKNDQRRQGHFVFIARSNK